jgi:hypothetical protein
MLRLTTGTCVLVFVVFGQSVRAICILPTFDRLLSDDRVAVLFRGTVVDLRPVRLPPPLEAGDVATFQVARVWKGQVHRDVTVYFVRGNALEGFPLELRKEYLVVAHLQSPVERRTFGLLSASDKSLASSQMSCGALPFESKDTQTLLRGAPGEPPR